MSAMKQVYDELNRVRNFLRRRVKLPELEVAVSRDLGVQLKADYIRDCRDPNLTVVGIPPIAGRRIYVDQELTGRQFAIKLAFKVKEATDEN